MSDVNNNIMSTIKRNPLVSLIVVVVVILAIVLIVNMRGSKEEFSPSDTSAKIIENFPQGPMNVMYSDSAGNLGTTTDLGLDYLTVTSNSDLSGNILSQDVFGKGSQLTTDSILAGTGHSGRLHLMGDNLYMMAKNGVRITSDNSSPNPWGAPNGNLTVDGKIVSSSLGSNIDWLRINDDVKNVGRTAIHGKLVISDIRKGHGGLIVGNDWTSNVGEGNIKATGEISAPSIKASSLSGNNISTSGTLSAENVNAGAVSINGYGNVKTKLDDLFTRLSALESKVNVIDASYIKGGQTVSLQGRNGRLDNYGGRCNSGDGDRDTGVQCGGGHGGEYTYWNLNKV